MLPEVISKRYCISPKVSIENFDEGALVLCLDLRQMYELNETARDVLKLTDGHRNLEQIGISLAEEYGISPAEMITDLMTLYQQLIANGIVEYASGNKDESEECRTACSSSEFICNPDAVFQEEDDDGGFLYDTRTGRIHFLNATGLVIWKSLQNSSNLSAALQEIENSFMNVSKDYITTDVQDFIDKLVSSGFIGLNATL